MNFSLTSLSIVFSNDLQAPWADGLYRLRMIFKDEYPTVPPECKFEPALFHPNVYPSGTVCLSLLDVKRTWHETFTITRLLLEIQHMLNQPETQSVVNFEAQKVFCLSCEFRSFLNQIKY